MPTNPKTGSSARLEISPKQAAAKIRRERAAHVSGNGVGDPLPPHVEDVERAALAGVCVAADTSRAEAEALLTQLRPNFFYGHAERIIHDTLAKLAMEGHALDLIMLSNRLKADSQPHAVVELATSLPNLHLSLFNFPEYVRVLKEFALRRWTLMKSARLCDLSKATELSPETLQTEFSELYDKSQRIGQSTRERLKIWTPKELQAHVPNPQCQLVGDNEIVSGYEGVSLVSGPGSSGKSLAVLALALAGAIGSGTWMGRKVHRQFKTLIIQAENGTRRLKEDVEAMIRAHPEHAKAIAESICFSDPPEGGLPFHHSEFRAAVRRAIDSFKPDLVVIDPWSQVASEDAAKEVIEKLTEIRSCFPAGEACPGLLIVAHTKKPRADEVRKGRGLVYSISGSIALPNTARCVYMLLPWSDEPEDHRIYWACVKLNDGQMYAPTVWLRRRGTFFVHDDKTDPTAWGREEVDRGAISTQQLRDCFEGSAELMKKEIVKRLVKMGCNVKTAYRALDEDGYLRAELLRTGTGKFKLKEA